MSQLCKKIKVSGRVQGVFFRAFTQEVAQKLQIKGWVSNEDDGSVVAFACGSTEQLDTLIAALNQGPPAARVDKVEVETANYQQCTDFTILR